MNSGVQRRLVRAAVAMTTLLGSSTIAIVESAPSHAATTTITVDGTKGGRTFDGIGAISGGGGNSRLLFDYPATQRTQILDYLFKPGVGADLQILKTEIGGNTNSTDGSESSIEPVQGQINCGTGYEWWLMEQAKARNPNIKLYGLAWGAPGWVGEGSNTFFTNDGITYLVDWLNCAKSNGLTIDYLGGWNERSYNISWYENLRSTLNSKGYSAVQIVGADDNWNVANDIVANSTFASSIQIIGAHYPCQGGDFGNADTCPSTANAVASGKPLWASENGSQDENTGAPAMVRSINRGYIDGSLTAYINWPLIAAVYPNLPYNTDGLMLANQPWSGNYTVGLETWVAAHYTQFTSPGWNFIQSASGYLGGTESNGTYVTLRQPSGSNYSTIVETSTTSSAQTLNLHVQGGLSTGTVHVYGTNLNSTNSSTWFTHVEDITPSGGSYSFTAQPGFVYTLSTMTEQGKGTATAPSRFNLALPYSDNFDSDAVGSAAKYLANQQGDFQIHACDAGRTGECVRQMAPVTPVIWDTDGFPNATLGDLSWTNYTVKADVLLEQAGYAQLLGRVGTQTAGEPANINAYALHVSNTGAWSIVKTATKGNPVTLASGTTTALGTNSWHTLAVTFSGSTITGSVDGHTVGSATDGSYPSGMIGIGTGGYQTDEFDNLAVTAGSGPASETIVNRNSGLCLDVTGTSTQTGALIEQWTCNGGANQAWERVGNTLVNVNSGLCLDIPSGSKTEGTQLDQWTCNGGSNQSFSQATSGGYTIFTSTDTGQVLDVSGGSKAAGGVVDEWPADGGANQQWTINTG